MIKLLLAIVTMVTAAFAWFTDKSRKRDKKQEEAVNDARRAHENKDVSGLINAIDRIKRMR